MKPPLERALPIVVALCISTSFAPAQAPDAADWPMYNRDVVGSRFNPAETAIAPHNAAQLTEKWRFPPAGADWELGVVHATPAVVAGYVYFGTATDPAFYKLAPDGSLCWTYRHPDRPAPAADDGSPAARLLSAAEGIFASAAVDGENVYFADVGGWLYALDRRTGAERWKLNTRGDDFPGAHPINVIMASPILAAGKLIVAGGALEQVYMAFPGYRGCTGRGFVMALDPESGRIEWKYDLGEEPQPLDPPIVITDSWGDHTFYFGPATSSIWSTPSYDEETGSIYFGTDVNTAPRRPTDDDPRLHTRESCAVVALEVRGGSEKWLTQIAAGDVWTNAMRAYDPVSGLYKDQSIGDTPKIYSIAVDGASTKVVGVGCKNGGYYVLRADDGRIVAHTPLYTGPPAEDHLLERDPRTLALPGPIGGLQTGCATDGRTIFTGGIDAILLGTQESQLELTGPPSGGRVVALSLDAREEFWRHERPQVDSLGGPPPSPVFTDVGDPVASGIAVANGIVYFTTVASGKLVALDASTGQVLTELDLGPVWSGPSVSRGRVYVGTGNTLFFPSDDQAFFPKRYTGTVYSFGLPGADETTRLGAGRE